MSVESTTYLLSPKGNGCKCGECGFIASYIMLGYGLTFDPKSRYYIPMGDIAKARYKYCPRCGRKIDRAIMDEVRK